MTFLRFDSELAMRTQLAEFLVEDRLPPYIGTAAVDVVGTIYRPTGRMIDGPTAPIPELVALPGWHVNLSEHIPALQAFEVHPSDAPARAFAGAGTLEEPRVPAEVSRWQCIRALRLIQDPNETGQTCLTTVEIIREQLMAANGSEQLVADIDDALNNVIFWRRDSPMLLMIAQTASWPTAFVDELFITANSYDL